MRVFGPVYTPNPEQDPRNRRAVDLVRDNEESLVHGSTLLRFTLCEHHAHQFVWEQRRRGDRSTYHVFHRLAGVTCGPCIALDANPNAGVNVVRPVGQAVMDVWRA